MKKTFRYTSVKLIVHESVKSIDSRKIDVVLQLGTAAVGKCKPWIAVGGTVWCEVESSADLKGKYPILTGTLSSSGVLEPISLIASEDKLNADEALEPFS